MCTVLPPVFVACDAHEESCDGHHTQCHDEQGYSEHLVLCEQTKEKYGVTRKLSEMQIVTVNLMLVHFDTTIYERNQVCAVNIVYVQTCVLCQ